MTITTIPTGTRYGAGFSAAADAAAAALFGTSDFDAWDDSLYPPTRFTTATGGTGAITTKSVAAGVYNLTTGATAASLACLFLSGTQFYAPSTERFYVRVRGAIPAAVGAAAQVVLGPISVGAGGLPGFGIGVDGAVSTTKYALLAYNLVGTLTASAQFAPNIDTSPHTFEIWCLGANTLYGCIDGGAVQSIAFAAQPASQFAVTARNRTDAVAYQMDLDAYAVRHGRP